MWLLLDNYDSFTHILHHYLELAGGACAVHRNDALTVQDIERMQPERIIISPGPETPDKAGITLEVIRRFHDRIPILGVCLGHQAIAQVFGADLSLLPQPLHGKQSSMHITKPHPIFLNLPTTLPIARYHSWTATNIEEHDLDPLACAEDDGSIQALAHRRYACTGIQFHPESVLTPAGFQIIQNWARHCG